MDVSALRKRARDLLVPFRWDLLGFALSRAYSTAMLAFASSALWAAGLSLGLQVAIYLCATVSAVVVAASAPGSAYLSSRGLWAVAVLGAFGAGCVAMGVALDVSMLVFAGCLFAGVCGGCFESVWGRRFTLLNGERIQSYTLLMTAVAAVLGTLLGLASGPLLFVPIATMPLVAVVLYVRGDALADVDDGSDPVAAEPSEVRDLRHRALINVLVCCLVFSAIYNMVVVLTYDYIPAGTASQMRFGANFVTALILLAFSVFLRPMRSTTLFKLVLPVTAVGFVLYLMAPQSLGWMSLAVSGVGRKLFDILVWILVAQAVRTYALEANRYFGFLIAGKNLGYLLGLLLATVTLTYDPGVVQIVTVVPVLLLVLIVLFSWVSPERIVGQLFEVVELSAPERSCEVDLDAKAAFVARECACTPREAEVLALLARGRTQAVIAAKLGISTGTAHTHIVHVYQKLGVGKQQELIEKVETAELCQNG